MMSKNPLLLIAVVIAIVGAGYLALNRSGGALMGGEFPPMPQVSAEQLPPLTVAAQ